MKIGVFCSANENLDADFYALTAELGRWAAREDHTIVFGGCNMGLMGCVSRAVHEAGGRLVGVVPRLMEKGGRVAEEADVCIWCDNLSDRKDLLLAHSDVVVALPGGIGTLDEVFTVLASATIGYHVKRVVLYNMKGFWDSLLAMLADLRRQGVLRKDFDGQLAVVNTLDELADSIGNG